MSKRNEGWLDTNVLLRFLIRDHEGMFARARALFFAAEQGEVRLFIHPLIVAELVWTLESFYGYGKPEIVQVLSALIEADGIQAYEKETVRNALLLYREKNVDYVDAYLSAHAKENGPATIYSFDKKHFSRLGGGTVIL